jgi:hypothetical protein
MCSKAVRLLQEGQYQDALNMWEEVKAIDSKYPNRQWVQRTAKKKLAEMTKPVKVKPKGATKKFIWMGTAVFVSVAVIVVGVALLANFGKQMLSSSTSTPTRTAVPFWTSIEVPSNQELFSRAVGEWESADWSDGSHMTMTIKRVSSGQYTFAVADDSAGFCDGGSGKAEFRSDTLSNTATGTFEFVCDSSGNSGNFEYKFTYNSVNDQFVDYDGVIWERKK